MAEQGPLIYRQKRTTRATHWLWAICLFFLMFSGLQIFNAHPYLHFGKEAGFEYDNAAVSIIAYNTANGLQGITTVLGHDFDTTGVLGVSDGRVRGIPAALTMPSGQSLATGRVIHFFFAWILVTTLVVWLVSSIINGHFKTLIPTAADIRGLPQDVADHARLRFHHTGKYNVLQKLAYASVLFLALPLMIATGLTMSPGFNSVAPWLLDLFGGRQSARSIHFLVMLALILFFFVHMAMILAAGPLNELRSIVTGWYRVDPVKGGHDDQSA
ncbi:MAG: cytochrome b/b6 domain-containing protein [Paracoccaceae bacterium]